ncbi:hypothetical protein AAVH_25375 [Aphelenchoides avenae]|nr:hypothetical protein AAVH_25375 [Aphelenchus avenae]
MRNTKACDGKRYRVAWIGLSAPWDEWEWVDDKPYNYSNWLYTPGYDCAHRRDCAAAIRLPDDGDQLGKWAYFYTSQAGAYFPTVCARAPNY